MEELITRAKNGNKQAFSDLFFAISDDLYKIAKTRISNEDDIDDAIQETMIEVYKSVHKLKDNKKFKKWVIKVLINKCNRIYRRKYKNDILVDDYSFIDTNINNITELENNINFYDLIKSLKYEERIISTLYYMEDYSVKEIKSILKMNENTINTHLHRARQKIKNKYYGRNFNE